MTSSTTTAGGLCTGLGLSPDKVECVMGVVKVSVFLCTVTYYANLAHSLTRSP